MMNLFSLSRKIHRLLVLVISFMTLVMGFSGLAMKYPSVFSGIVDIGLVRSLHNGLSLWFTLGLVLMGVSGLLMYFIPYIRSKKMNDQNQVN